MRFISLLLFSIFIFSPSPASALTITWSGKNPFDGSSSRAESILLNGEITPGDYDKLLDFIHNDEDRFWLSTSFVLASRGGDVDEALKIARLVKGTFSSAFVGEATGPCVSACFFIYVASARREAAPGSLGIHRPYVHPRRLLSMSTLEAESTQKYALREARIYLEDEDVPTALIDKMFQLASTEMYWLSSAEIQAQLGRRPPWYEQLLIAKCGLDKSMERRYFSTGEKSLLDQLHSVDKCAAHLSYLEGRTFLRSALRASVKSKSLQRKGQ